ncbi:uncharacterized protein LOC126748328 [Anthonomus grandis grandis]|uniref:uncharacterized protein LOC126748328 n=1 Tax=Anthonomus grandis grandis TaxID=2921223 RepID=UPI0021652318|nr:uncharacterized protein LOC126748328 [Anthonomus grandis grandis]XP_050313437.1 uncharacterized protein LOC126748328 [Anthonomus grandis grandis]
MECADLMLFVCLLVTCCITLGATQKQGLNGHCTHVSECGKIGYFCSRNRTCQCFSGYTPNKAWTKCLGYIGVKCKYDSHCIEGAYCSASQNKEVCRCKEEDGLIPNEDNTACISSTAHSKHKPSVSRLLFVAIYWIGLYLNT